MVKSMTGFASLTRERDGVTVGVTIRSVNHRHLDLQLRVPPAIGALESRLRSLIQARVARGRVELAVVLTDRRAAAVAIELNEALVEALAAALDRARARGLVSGTLTSGDLLRFPQAVTVRETPGGDVDASSGVPSLVEEGVVAALEELDQMRAHEGDHLVTDLSARAARAADLVDQIASAADEGSRDLAARLSRRVAELAVEATVDPAVVAQEIVRAAARSDISEEVVRFRAHVAHWTGLVRGPEPCGRKLDFLLQEMNREVNTMGAKAEGPRIGELIITVKAELERMREQVQNVE